MKKTMLMALFIASTIVLKAKTIQQDTTFLQTPALSQFNGTWEYSLNGNLFRIVIKNNKIYLKQKNIYLNFLEGYHLYIKNGKTIQSSLSVKKTIILGDFAYDYESKKISDHIIKFTFLDMERPIGVDGIMELLPGNKLRWLLKNKEGLGFKQKDGREQDYHIYVPNHIILTKVE